MVRCNRTINLEVHHIRRNERNELSNAQVLCQQCYSATKSYGMPGKAQEPFSEVTKMLALTLAGNQCECVSPNGCH